MNGVAPGFHSRSRATRGCLTHRHWRTFLPERWRSPTKSGPTKQYSDTSQAPDPDYIDRARRIAAEAVRTRGFERRAWTPVTREPDFSRLFDYPELRPPQRAVIAAPVDQPLLILESDIASIIVAVTAIGGAVWILLQRSATRIRETARSPRVVAAYRQAVAALVPVVLIAGVVAFVETRLDHVITRIETRLQATEDLVRVQSGVIVVSDAEAHESGLATTDNGSCSIARGLSGARVDFGEPFASPPEVLVSLTQIDQETRGAAILRIVVTAIDAGGFNYDLHTWCNTRVARVRAEWIAVAR